MKKLHVVIGCLLALTSLVTVSRAQQVPIVTTISTFQTAFPNGTYYFPFLHMAMSYQHGRFRNGSESATGIAYPAGTFSGFSVVASRSSTGTNTCDITATLMVNGLGSDLSVALTNIGSSTGTPAGSDSDTETISNSDEISIRLVASSCAARPEAVTVSAFFELDD